MFYINWVNQALNPFFHAHSFPPFLSRLTPFYVLFKQSECIWTTEKYGKITEQYLSVYTLLEIHVHSSWIYPVRRLHLNWFVLMQTRIKDSYMTHWRLIGWKAIWQMWFLIFYINWITSRSHSSYCFSLL